MGLHGKRNPSLMQVNCISDVARQGLFLAGAVRAGALDEEVDFLALEAFRQLDLARQSDFGKAGDLLALGALEMRMFVRMLAAASAETPDLVGAGNAVDQFIFSQPLQHAV